MKSNEINEAKEPLIHITKRPPVSFKKAICIRLAAFALAMLCCGIVSIFLVEKIQNNPARLGEFYASYFIGNFSTGRKIFKFLKDTAILLGISLAVTPAFRMKFWNIGAEGQTLVGVLGAIAVAFYCGAKVPNAVLLILMFLAALLSGAVWGLIPALFKAKWNTNETLFTLMMNYIATYLVAYCLVIWVPNGSSTLGKLRYGALPTLTIGSIGNTYIVIIAAVLLLTAGLYIYLNYSKHGYEISVVGGSENTAKYIGINVNKVIIRTMVVSGLLCGFVGFLIAAGLDQSVTTESVGGQGFTAIMVSWLAKFNPLYMLLTSALIIFLQQGSGQISQTFDISGDFPEIVVGIILFFIIGCEFFINYKIHFRKKTETKEEKA